MLPEHALEVQDPVLVVADHVRRVLDLVREVLDHVIVMPDHVDGVADLPDPIADLPGVIPGAPQELPNPGRGSCDRVDRALDPVLGVLDRVFVVLDHGFVVLVHVLGMLDPAFRLPNLVRQIASHGGATVFRLMSSTLHANNVLPAPIALAATPTPARRSLNKEAGMGKTHRTTLRATASAGGMTRVRAHATEALRQAPAGPRRSYALFRLLLLLMAWVFATAHCASGPPRKLPQRLAEMSCPAIDEVPSPFPADLPRSPTASAGAIPGAFSLTPTGEATYTLPLLVPPGRAGIEPTLALTYDSAAGEGLLGMGFSLAGLSAVTRCPQNLAQDRKIRGVTYDPDDPLCLDGKRLVAVGFQPGAVEYRTFPDTFVKVLAYQPHGWDWTKGPQSLRVFTKSGLIADYGSSPTGQEMAKDGVIRAWWVTQMRDRRGNTIDFTYRNDKDPAEGYTVEHAPLRIDYTGHPEAPASRAVVFDYTSKASQHVRTRFSGGMALRRSLRLDKVRMLLEPSETLVREYRLSYDLGPATGRTILKQVEECAPDSICKPPTRFWWNSGPAGFTSIPTPAKAPLSALASVMLFDMTGDGLDDLVVPDVEQIGGIGEIPITNYFVTPNVGPKPSGSTFFTTTQSAREEEHYGDIPLPVQPALSTPIDYNQDGLTDLFLHDVHGNFPDWTILLATPEHTFEALDTGLPHPPGLGQISPVHLRDHDVSAHLADVDGDGIADLIQCADDGTTFAWTAHLWTPDGPGWTANATPIPSLLGYPCDTALLTVDVNSDRQVDLLVRKSHWSSDGPVFEGTYAAISFGPLGAWDATDTALPIVPWGADLLFLDVNGDGLPDAIETGFGDRQLRTFVNTGQGFAPPVNSLASPVLEADQLVQLATPIDFNGDGLQDLLVPMQTGANALPSWVILQATGSVGDGTFTVVDPAIPFEAQLLGDGITLADGRIPRVTDVDGNGAQDVVLALNKTFQVFRSSAADQDLLSLVSDGLHALDPDEPGFVPNLVITYDHLLDLATTQDLPKDSSAREMSRYLSRDDPGNGCAYPVRCVVGPRRVVSEYRINRGDGALCSFMVRYRDGRYHRLGRGFLGFGERIVLDLATGAGTAEFYDNVTFDPALQAFPYAGQAVRIWRYNPGLPSQPEPDRIELLYTQVVLEAVPTYGGVTYFTLPLGRKEIREQGSFPPGGTSGQTVEQYVRATANSAATILGGSQQIVTAYDSYGNLKGEETTTAGVDLTLRVERTFANDEKTWRIGELLSQEECSGALLVEQCRRLIRIYDKAGTVHIEAQGTEGDLETQRTLTFTRDVFGNVIETTAEDASGDKRSACTSYDGEGLFPFAQKNPAGHLSFTKFDPGLGVRTAAVDPNQRVTRWAHDGFGRMTQEKRPDGTTTKATWTRTKDGGAQGNAWNVKQRIRTVGLGDDTVEYDSLGRAIRAWTQGVQPQGAPPPPRIVHEIAYDDLGEHVARRLVPTSEQTPESSRLYERFAYDALGRVVLHTTPWKGITDYHYDGARVMLWGPQGALTTIENDALGRPVVVQDPRGGVTVYQYGPFGGLWMVTDPGGAVTLTQRDAYGRIRTQVDPDRHTTRVHYNGFGQRTSSIDALGREIKLGYDPLGRLLTREDADGTTTWTWDTAAHGIGQLERVTSPAGHQVTSSYDDLGRLSTTALSIDDETFTSRLTYDGFGRVDTIAYPKPDGARSFVLRHKYDAHGHVREVQEAKFGSPYWTLQAADGAGRVLTETFGNKVTTTRSYFEDKDRVKSIVTASDTWKLQDLSYDYDDQLNLTRRTDGLQYQTEHFAYDKLDRLTCASLDNLVSCHPLYVYAPNGNIESKSDVGSYTYSPDHPHAVQKAGGASFDYDAVGNQRARPGATITYTAFDLPKTFTPSQGEPITLEYDGHQRRIRKTTPDEVTVSFGELYERITHPLTGVVQHRYYVHAGGRVVAVVTRETEKPGVFLYVHVDNLGSVDVITDEAQKVVERRSYDASGARRNPSWGKTGAGPYAAQTTRGFTGHEDDAELGLVNMKGRIYDPTVARFLTPDPIVSVPHFGQSYNRYAYVLNNPLAYVDPSGFAAQEEEAAGGTPPTLADGSNEIVVVGHKRELDGQDTASAGAEVRAITVPVDVGVAGTPSGFMPAPMPAGPEQSTISKVGDTALGVAEGTAEVVLEVAKFGVLNAVTLGGYGTYGLGKALWRGFQEDGVLGAINAVNPFHAIATGAEASALAAKAGDFRAAGAAGAKVAILAAAMVYGAGEGAGAVAEEGAAAGAAAEARVGVAEEAAAAGVAKGGTYVLRDRATGQVMRTGRTNNLVRREAEHARDPNLGKLDFKNVHKTDSYMEQRGLEQMLHDNHNPPFNKINPINPSNPLHDIYMDAAKKFMGQ